MTGFQASLRPNKHNARNFRALLSYIYILPFSPFSFFFFANLFIYLFLFILICDLILCMPRMTWQRELKKGRPDWRTSPSGLPACGSDLVPRGRPLTGGFSVIIIIMVRPETIEEKTNFCLFKTPSPLPLPLVVKMGPTPPHPCCRLAASQPSLGLSLWSVTKYFRPYLGTLDSLSLYLHHLLGYPCMESKKIFKQSYVLIYIY